MSTGEVADPFARQREIVPADKITPCTVIGVGAIGRQVAIMLTGIGVKDLTIFDFDNVELTNINTQLYLHEELGLQKVDAVRGYCHRVFPDTRVKHINDRYRPKYKDDAKHAVFCCVDSITSRKAIWESVSRDYQFWVDGRMLGETMAILTADPTNKKSAEKYAKSLHSEGEVVRGSCGSLATPYTACIAAGLMVHQYTRKLRGFPTDDNLLYDMLGGLYQPLALDD